MKKLTHHTHKPNNTQPHDKNTCMQQQQHPQKTCMQQQQQGVQWHMETLPLLCGICVQCNVLGFSPLGEGDVSPSPG